MIQSALIHQVGHRVRRQVEIFPGGYECQCAEGFKKQGNFCIDLNECAIDGMFSCAPDSQSGFPDFH